jgi:hypothetical protein
MSCIFKPLLVYKLECETALGYSSILTGLQPFGDKGFSWNGISDAQDLDWVKGSPSEVGACATFNKIGPSNFMCEEKRDKNSREWVMSLIFKTNFNKYSIPFKKCVYFKGSNRA